jgi:hypothetical protein
MSWTTDEDARSYSRFPNEPDIEVLRYWLSPLWGLIETETEDEIICVFANRTGTDKGAVYAGTSAVLGIKAGEVLVYGVLGRGENKLLIVDTNEPASGMLVPANPPSPSISDQPNSIVNIPVAMTSKSNEAIEGVLAPVHLTSTQPEESNPYFPRPKSPIRRPNSPKSRNASRVREPLGASLVEDPDNDASTIIEDQADYVAPLVEMTSGIQLDSSQRSRSCHF